MTITRRQQQKQHLRTTLRDWMQREGLDYTSAAARLGVSMRSLEDYVSDKNEKLPRSSTLHDMATALGMTSAELLGEQDSAVEERANVMDELARLREEIAALRRAIGQLPQ